MDFDLDSIRLQPEASQEATTKTKAVCKPAKRKQKVPFIMGPLPLPWFQKAMQIPGRTALPLGLSLWFQAGLEGTRNDLRLTAKLKGKFSLKDRSVTAALRSLESAGLVSVQRPPGQCVRITILDGPLEAS